MKSSSLLRAGGGGEGRIEMLSKKQKPLTPGVHSAQLGGKE